MKKPALEFKYHLNKVPWFESSKEEKGIVSEQSEAQC